MPYEIHDKNTCTGIGRGGRMRDWFPAVTVSKYGVFRLNCEAGKMILNGSSRVLLFKDPETLKIAMRAAGDDDARAYEIRREKNGEAASFSAIWFLREIALYRTKAKFRPKLNPELDVWELEPIDPENW